MHPTIQSTHKSKFSNQISVFFRYRVNDNLSSFIHETHVLVPFDEKKLLYILNNTYFFQYVTHLTKLYLYLYSCPFKYHTSDNRKMIFNLFICSKRCSHLQKDKLVHVHLSWLNFFFFLSDHFFIRHFKDNFSFDREKKACSVKSKALIWNSEYSR